MGKHKSNLTRVTAIEAARRAADFKEVSTFEEHYTRVEEDSWTTKAADFDLVRDMTGDSGNGLWEADVKSTIDAATLKSLFFSEDWVYIIVDLIASKIASNPLKVMRRVLMDGTYRMEQAEGHPVQAMLDSPNQLQDYFEWMYTLVVDLFLLGNSIQWKLRAKNQIIGLPAEAITMDFSPNGAIKQYLIADQSQEGQLVRGNIASFLVEDVVHFRRPNPGSMLWGLSPFIPGRRSVLFNRYTAEYLNNFYLKGATPGLALEMDKEANEKVALRLLRSFEMAYTGRRNQRRTMALPKGVTVKQIAHSIADQGIVELINMNRENTIALLKVPKHEVGLQTSGSLGSEEYKQALKNFWESTLIPATKLIQLKLSKFLARDLGQNFLIEFDLSGVEVLKSNETQKAELATKMLTTHTVNEVRKEIYEAPPLPGGDTLQSHGAVPSFGMPSTPSAATPTGEGLPATAEANAVTSPTQTLNGAQITSLVQIVQSVTDGLLARDAALAIIQVSFALSQQNAEAVLGTSKVEAPKEGVQPSQTPLAGGQPAAEVQQPPASQGLSVSPVNTGAPTVVGKDKLLTFLKGQDDWFARREQKIAETSGKSMGLMESIALTMFSDMAITIISTARKHLQEKAYDGFDTKATPPKTKLVSKAELRRRLRKSLDKFEERWVSDTRKALVSSVDAGYSAMIEVPFNLPSASEIQGLRTRNEQVRLDALDNRQSRAFQYMEETTLNKVFITIEQGIDEGKTVAEISNDLKSSFANVAEIGSRAMMIARTETLTAVSLGQAAAMKDAASVIPNLQKMWLSADDDRVRDSHSAVDGEVRSWDSPFSNQLFFPRDPGGPPEETINCRCTFVALPKDQMEDVSGDNLVSNEGDQI